MLNYIWFGMMFIAVIVGIFTGNIDAVTEAAISILRIDDVLWAQMDAQIPDEVQEKLQGFGAE